MKTHTFRLSIGVIAAAALAIGAASAQDLPPTPVTADAVAPAAPAAAGEAAAPPPADRPAQAPAAQTLSHEQLDQLVAPVALYPDQLLGQVLMASTYPLEVVEAARWVGVAANRALRGDALVDAVKGQNWDPSVMALVPFPRVLELMNSKIEWTRQVGAAFFAQQADVMDSVQRLRHLAMTAGNLQTTPQCHCVVATKGETITVTALDIGPVCMPVYNTRVVYGAWPYPMYPPVTFPVPADFAYAPGLAIGFAVGVDVALYGPLWGWSSIDWGPRRIVVDGGRFNAIAPTHRSFADGVWTHDSARGERASLSRAAFAGRVAAGRFGHAGAVPFHHPGAAVHHAAAFRGGPVSHRGPAFHGGGGHGHAEHASVRGGPSHGGGGGHGGGGHGDHHH